ncbi:hypothetical protein QP116_02790 [Pseudoglutamicibacter cumminsii]|uniref:Uncharacterized protein n=1 Tax=Pseudoglutamicibacter cumminsii TaxID=156979 RepID=A0AAP4FD93_9MICC|nr:hypothetical protein [Pseudoglutamicibacter cumminsii]MDK6274679.1 hypothetical protein [Pseudoglutamicibacter cumminsii]
MTLSSSMLLAGPRGRRLLLEYALESERIAGLDGRDGSLAELEFLPPTASTQTTEQAHSASSAPEIPYRKSPPSPQRKSPSGSKPCSSPTSPRGFY